MAAGDATQSTPVKINLFSCYSMQITKLHACIFDSSNNLITFWCVLINLRKLTSVFWVLSLKFPSI